MAGSQPNKQWLQEGTLQGNWPWGVQQARLGGRTHRHGSPLVLPFGWSWLVGSSCHNGGRRRGDTSSLFPLFVFLAYSKPDSAEGHN